MKHEIKLEKRTEGERKAYIEGYGAGKRMNGLNKNVIEEIKQSLIQSNKDIDMYEDSLEGRWNENYARGYLGGSLEIVRILEKYYGKLINDDEIMEESK